MQSSSSTLQVLQGRKKDSPRQSSESDDPTAPFLQIEKTTLVSRFPWPLLSKVKGRLSIEGLL